MSKNTLIEDRYGAVTHEVFNQPPELTNYNLYLSDIVLQESVRREQGTWAEQELIEFGAAAGQADYLELGHLANRFPPELETHDRYGHRVDLIKFHPAYHALMKSAIERGIHSNHWTDPRGGAHVVRAAKFYIQTEVEAGHGCPITMTSAAVPTLRLQPDLAAIWLPKITARVYDPRNIPMEQKSGVTIGMAMTEKQGGSDVRANTTQAFALNDASHANAYELVGHKYFVSAPMCDAFLVLAQTAQGLTCFMLPRWRPDGSKNPMQIQRLKKKMGNVSNASSETELRGAFAWRVGPEGRGVATIIEMVAMTRFDCMIGSSAGQRAALTQALHHCSHRGAFGKKLVDQVLMQNVLADLALESEASTTLTMRIARALDQQENHLARLMTAVGKYWICKRTPQHAYEAMECIGGSGVMEDSPMPRLYREAPINAIWEGSGNVQCMDVLRALQKTPEVLQTFFDEIKLAQGGHTDFDRYVAQLKKEFANTDAMEARARNLVDRISLSMQAALLIQHAPNAIADAYCCSRLAGAGQNQYGALPHTLDMQAILQRAMPKL